MKARAIQSSSKRPRTAIRPTCRTCPTAWQPAIRKGKSNATSAKQSRSTVEGLREEGLPIPNPTVWTEQVEASVSRPLLLYLTRSRGSCGISFSRVSRGDRNRRRRPVRSQSMVRIRRTDSMDPCKVVDGELPAIADMRRAKVA